jgi:hypothetical protein
MPKRSTFRNEMVTLLQQIDRISKAMESTPAKPDKMDQSSKIVMMDKPPKSFKAIKAVMFEHYYQGIKTPFSYGNENDNWEVAVMTKESITYDTPITDDVVGNCSQKAVVELCKRIHALPATHA